MDSVQKRGPHILAAVATMIIVFAAPLHGDNMGTDEAYGIVRRKQISSNRVVFQPLTGVFLEQSDILVHYKKGIVLCKGKVQSVYKDEIYASVDSCDKFDLIEKDQGISNNGNTDKVLVTYRNRTSLEQDQREKEWKRSAGIPMNLDEDNYKVMVETSSLPVFVEFYATWCPVCKRYTPILGEIAKDLEGSVRVATIDAEKNARIAKELDVKAYPTLFLYRNGVIISRWARGANSKDPIVEFIRQNLGIVDK